MQPVEETSECIFNGLHTIKINNFQGSKAEMLLVKFLIEKAVNLESLVLVYLTSSYQEEGINNMGMVSTSQSQLQSCETQLRLLQDQLSILLKASSKARIVLYEQGKDESRLSPTHSGYYTGFKC